MKRILYYNNMIIDSIVSQFDKGLKLKETSETDKYSEDNDKVVSPVIEASGSVKIPKVIELNGKYTETTNETGHKHYSVTRRVNESVLYDYALNVLESGLSERKLFNNEDYSGYIKQTVCLEFYSIRESKNIIIGHSPKNNRTGKVVSDALQKIELLEEVLPYDYFALNEIYIIPLNKKYLRTSLKNLRINYKTQVTLLGIKNNMLSEAAQYCYWSIFEHYNKYISTALTNAFDNRKLTLIDPISIYL